MKTYSTTVRFARNGVFDDTDKFDVDIPEETKEDDIVDALMEALSPVLEEQFQDDEDWEEGNVTWTLVEWEEN